MPVASKNVPRPEDFILVISPIFVMNQEMCWAILKKDWLTLGQICNGNQ